MTPGPLQQHESRFRERNLLSFALLGLVSCALETRRLIAEALATEPACAPSPRGTPRALPPNLLLALGIVSFGKTLERHVRRFAAEGNARKSETGPASSRRSEYLVEQSVQVSEPIDLRSLLR